MMSEKSLGEHQHKNVHLLVQVAAADVAGVWCTDDRGVGGRRMFDHKPVHELVKLTKTSDWEK